MVVLALAVLEICWTSRDLRSGELPDDPELFQRRAIMGCVTRERSATGKDTSLANRLPVLAEPSNWKDVAGPNGERAVLWQETSRYHGYQIFDRRGQLLHEVLNVNLPRWSPDGRWLAVSHWSRPLPYQLALVEVATGNVIPIPDVEYLDDCAWSPDSRKLAFVGRSYPSGDSAIAGWLFIPDTSVHLIAQDLNIAFECLELAWSGDSRRFIALMHREYEHDDVRVTDLWLFTPDSGVCRLTGTPRIEESEIGWLDDRRVIFQADRWNNEKFPSGSGVVLEMPGLEKSPR